MGKIYRATWSPSTSRFHTVRVVTASGAMVKMGSSTTGVTWRSPERPAVVQLQPSAGPIPMSFEFTVTDLGVDDQTAVAGKPIALGAPTEGRLEVSGDVDVFSFTATAGHVIGASLALPTGTTESLRVRLFDANQTQVAVGSTGGRGLATTTGTYTVRVEASLASGPTDLLPYVLTVSDEGLDDHVNAAGTNTTPLTFGAPSPGALQYAGDLDAFGFTPQPGHLYQFNCTRPLGTCTVKIRNADGQMVAPVGFASATGVFFANVSGVWTAEVADLTSPGLLGPFSLTITDRGPEDHGATIADATPVTVGAPIASELAFAGDVDAFAFAATAGHVYRVTASGTPTLTLDVRTSSDLPVAYQSDSNTLSAFAATDGTLYVLAKASFSTATPAFTLTIVDEGLDDHGNLPSAGTPLAAGASTTGRVQYWQDVDYFTLAVTPRRHYRLQCTSQTTRCSIVVDAGGTVVTSSQSTGIPTVSFTPPANVTSVSVRISLSQLATYEVLATELAADDHGDLPSEATPLALEGAAVTGTLGVSNDVDQFSVASTAGEVVILTCTSTSGVACAMTLRTSTGGSATATSAPAAQTTLAALSTGAPVQVEVRSNGNATGTFDLSATRGSDDHTSPAPLSIGTPVTARIDYANDEDVFEVVLTTAQPVRLSVTGDTRAELFTPSGQYALTVSSSFGTVNYSPPATGTFTLRVKGASNSRPPGPYTITLQ